MVDAAVAGRRSGFNSLTLDGARPLHGLAGETAHRRPMTSSGHSVTSALGDSDDDQARSDVFSTSSSLRRRFGRAPRNLCCIPGYGGHIASKVAENVHGGTFHCENERAALLTSSMLLPRASSAPDIGNRSGRGLRHTPTVPGYAGFIPGKHSEPVIGLGFADANHKARELYNDAAPASDSWMRRGRWPVDRMSTYNFNNRFIQADTQPLFSEAQFAEAREMNQRLGQTFGLQPPASNPYRPGDRFLHIGPGGCQRKTRPRNTSKSDVAGASSYSPQLEQQRWSLHSGNLRFA